MVYCLHVLKFRLTNLLSLINRYFKCHKFNARFVTYRGITLIKFTLFVDQSCSNFQAYRKNIISSNEPAHEIWNLSHMRPAKAQASLRVCAVSSEPSLFAHMNYGSRRRVRPKIRDLAPLDGCACIFEEWIYGGQKVPKSHELAQIPFIRRESSKLLKSCDVS